MIKIDFEFETNFGVFRDALHLPDDHKLTDAQIESAKVMRLENWIALVSAPSIEELQE